MARSADDEAFPMLVATVSCEHAIDALRLRRELFPIRNAAASPSEPEGPPRGDESHALS